MRTEICPHSNKTCETPFCIDGGSCHIQSVNKHDYKRYFAVEYAGFWVIQTDPTYGGDDIFNAEHVGSEQAEKNAKLVEGLLNNNIPN